MDTLICKRDGLGSISLKRFEDDDDGMMWVSDEFNHGDWPFRYVVRLMYCEKWDREWAETQGKYHVSINVASPVAAEARLENVADGMGMSLEQFKAGAVECQCVALVQQGFSACLYQEQGNNMKVILQSVRKMLPEIDFMFGAYMDRSQNAIGDTGWDWVKGDFGAASRRRRAGKQTP
jgi:hypothetical protein